MHHSLLISRKRQEAGCSSANLDIKDRLYYILYPEDCPTEDTSEEEEGDDNVNSKRKKNSEEEEKEEGDA